MGKLMLLPKLLRPKRPKSKSRRDPTTLWSGTCMVEANVARKFLYHHMRALSLPKLSDIGCCTHIPATHLKCACHTCAIHLPCFCHTSSATHHLPQIICHTSSATHHLPHIICHTSFATHHLPHIICHTSFATHHLPHIICHTSSATHHLPHIICHTSSATHHLPHIICHTSFATHHLPHIGNTPATHLLYTCTHCMHSIYITICFYVYTCIHYRRACVCV